MNHRTIPNTTTKATSKIYKANFDRYRSDRGDAFLHFTDVRDEEGNLIKKSFIVSATKATSLIGNLLPGQEVSFFAEVVVAQEAESEDEDDFDFANISFITSKRKEGG